MFFSRVRGPTSLIRLAAVSQPNLEKGLSDPWAAYLIDVQRSSSLDLGSFSLYLGRSVG